jgi:hypothetical protein
MTDKAYRCVRGESINESTASLHWWQHLIAKVSSQYQQPMNQSYTDAIAWVGRVNKTYDGEESVGWYVNSL